MSLSFSGIYPIHSNGGGVGDGIISPLVLDQSSPSLSTVFDIADSTY